MMTKRSIAKRSHLTFYLDVIDTDTGEVIGKVADITVEGLMVLSKTVLEAGTEKNLMISSTDETFGEIEFTSECRWCKVDVNPDYYDIGFHVDHISDDDKQKIKDLITSSYFDN